MIRDDDPTASTPSGDGAIPVPREIGPIRVISEIGRGGMGSVWLGEHRVLQRPVAVKFLSSHGAELSEPEIEQFVEGARQAARVDADGLVRIHDASRVDGLPYMVMEFIEGEPLSRVIRPDGLPPVRARAAALEICEAVAALHDEEIIHRDIKPSNVIVATSGNIKLTDYGLTIGRDRESLTTHVGSVSGTPQYMAPECFEGRASLRSDVYALGLLIFEILTGSPAMRGSYAALRDAHLRGAIPLHLLQGNAADFEDIIRRACHLQPVYRYKTARHLAKAIESLEVSDGPPSPLPRRVRKRERFSPDPMGTLEPIKASVAASREKARYGTRAPRDEDPTPIRSYAETIPTDTPCIACGHNVRGIPTDGTCPECGNPVATSYWEIEQTELWLKGLMSLKNRSHEVAIFLRCCWLAPPAGYGVAWVLGFPSGATLSALWLTCAAGVMVYLIAEAPIRFGSLSRVRHTDKVGVVNQSALTSRWVPTQIPPLALSGAALVLPMPILIAFWRLSAGIFRWGEDQMNSGSVGMYLLAEAAIVAVQMLFFVPAVVVILGVQRIRTAAAGRINWGWKNQLLPSKPRNLKFNHGYLLIGSIAIAIAAAVHSLIVGTAGLISVLQLYPLGMLLLLLFAMTETSEALLRTIPIIQERGISVRLESASPHEAEMKTAITSRERPTPRRSNSEH